MINEEIWLFAGIIYLAIAPRLFRPYRSASKLLTGNFPRIVAESWNMKNQLPIIVSTHVQTWDLTQMNKYNLPFSVCIASIWRHYYKQWNTARLQEQPAFDKASDLTVTYLWSSCETLQHWAQGNNKSLMVKYVQVWKRILSQNIYGSWIASFRMPIISDVWDGSFVKCHDCPL